jgi:hypothetical protein
MPGDLNSWVATQKRRCLEELRAEVGTLRAAVERDHGAEGRGQRRMATRVITLLDLKLAQLGDEQAAERYERTDSQSADMIDEELRA